MQINSKLPVRGRSAYWKAESLPIADWQSRSRYLSGRLLASYDCPSSAAHHWPYVMVTIKNREYSYYLIVKPGHA
jgi:hypothetical protein